MLKTNRKEVTIFIKDFIIKTFIDAGTEESAEAKKYDHEKSCYQLSYLIFKQVYNNILALL